MYKYPFDAGFRVASISPAYIFFSLLTHISAFVCLLLVWESGDYAVCDRWTVSQKVITQACTEKSYVWGAYFCSQTNALFI